MKVSEAKTRFVAGKAFRITAITTVVAAVFFAVTNPSQGNMTLIMLGSVIMAVTLYIWVALFVKVVVSQRFLETQGTPRLALLLTIPVIYVILMQSIGQLNIQDILAIVPLVGILYLYLLRSTASRT